MTCGIGACKPFLHSVWQSAALIWLIVFVEWRNEIMLKSLTHALCLFTVMLSYILTSFPVSLFPSPPLTLSPSGLSLAICPLQILQLKDLILYPPNSWYQFSVPFWKWIKCAIISIFAFVLEVFISAILGLRVLSSMKYYSESGVAATMRTHLWNWFLQ